MTAMQSTIDSERFDLDWNLMTGSFWAMGMAVTIAEAIVEGRLVQQVVHGLVLNQRDPKLTLQMLNMAQNVLYAMNNELLFRFARPAWIELACSYLVLWVLWSTSTGVSDARIMFGLGVATNAVLTALTGKLESGAIYCIAALILVISLSLGDLQLCTIAFGVGQQLLNIIPTFTLVYVGLANPVDDRPAVTHQVPSKHAAFRSAAVQQPIQPRQVTETCRLPVIENIGKTLNITFKQHSTVPIAFRWSYLMKFI
ncbi:hypothetical protein B0H13DRAFT_2507204 [Mycena leptocephala]|nr:hypothetical protein B0H13DRAFT_2507204 [Mycena leptocephala]